MAQCFLGDGRDWQQSSSMRVSGSLTRPRGFLLTSGVVVATAAISWFLYYRYPRRRPSDEAADDLSLLPDDNVGTLPLPHSDTPLTRAELLERFPSLERALSRSPLVGLYFGAGWCPDCVSMTPAVRRLVQSDANDDDSLTVVYISSDHSDSDMQMCKPPCFDHVDFDRVGERVGLKLWFGVCALKEVGALTRRHRSFRRRHGIPTLIVLESATGRVLTEQGVDHCGQARSAEQVLDGWKSMMGECSATGDDSFDGIHMMDTLLHASKSQGMNVAEV